MRVGKMTQTALAVTARLAEGYDRNERLSSAQIAKVCGLSQPLVAKVLTTLSQAGIVHGTPGPGGGYGLARDPGKVSIWDVRSLFERTEGRPRCFFSQKWCGDANPCPVHEQFATLRRHVDAHLHEITFGPFRAAANGSAAPSPRRRKFSAKAS